MSTVLLLLLLLRYSNFGNVGYSSDLNLAKLRDMLRIVISHASIGLSVGSAASAQHQILSLAG